MIDIDYWAEAAATKRTAARLKAIAPDVRRLGTSEIRGRAALGTA